MHVIGFRRRVAALAAAVLFGASGLVAVAAGAAPAAAAPDYARACDQVDKPRQAVCLTLIRTDVAQRRQSALAPHAAPTGFGYGPADLQNAYNLPSATAGTGATVAIVGAFDAPTAEADLAAYREAYGLPPCTTADGCFTKVNQNGQTSPLPNPSGGTGWATETSLDLDMVSAACPNCSILLVEADSPDMAALGAAVNTAVRLGAVAVSNSYGSSQGEYAGEAEDDAAYFDHPGVAIVAASGDFGFGTMFPAASPHVISVGGTSLNTSSDSRGWSETVWTGAGSGCSTIEPKPDWQTDSGCPGRTDNDVSAVSDPDTGVAVYDTYDQNGWLQVGGTSAASPLIAAMYAMAGEVRADYPAENIYHHTSELNDVVNGTNGSCAVVYLCTGQAGYDAPTGWGTPNGVTAFGSGDQTGNIVRVTNPGGRTATQDVQFSLQIRASDSAPDETLTFTATGLPDGLSVDRATGAISGTPTEVGTSDVKVTATDSTGASGTTAFTIAVASPVALTGVGPQSGYLGQPVAAAFPATDVVSGRTVTYSADGLPGGLSIDASTGRVTGVLESAGYKHTTITARDSAGRSSSASVVWYVASAQASARTGPISLNGGAGCLAAADGAATLATCPGGRGPAWTLRPDGTLRTADQCLTAGDTAKVTDCGTGTDQKWRIGTFGQLTNPVTGHCLSAQASGASNGAPLGLRSCAGDTGQRWTLPAGPLLSAVPGLCADGGDGGVRTWYCGNANGQAWTVATDGTIRLAGRCLSTGHDNAIQLARCDGTTAQQWQIHGDGTLTDQATGACLGIPNDSRTVATPLKAAPCDARIGQLWHIE